MNLEPVLQSELSQKEKDKYHILTHIYGIEKNGPDVSIAGQQHRHRYREHTCVHSWGRRGWDELRALHWNMCTVCAVTSDFLQL